MKTLTGEYFFLCDDGNSNKISIFWNTRELTVLYIMTIRHYGIRPCGKTRWFITDNQLVVTHVYIVQF